MAAFAVLSPTAFPVHHAQVFLLIAAHEPVTYRRIEEGLSLDNGTVSRVVAVLGSEHWRGYPGFGLVETFRDPAEGRRFMVRLTAKGRAMVRQLQAI